MTKDYIEKIEFIDLVLENCEVYRIAKEDVHSVIVKGVKTSAHVNPVGQFYTTDYCEDVAVTIKNKEYRTLQEDEIDTNHIPFKIRMEKYRDITSVCVLGKNEKGESVEFQYCVPFYDKYEDREISSENMWQVTSYDGEYIQIRIRNLAKDE